MSVEEKDALSNLIADLDVVTMRASLIYLESVTKGEAEAIGVQKMLDYLIAQNREDFARRFRANLAPYYPELQANHKKR